MEDQIQAQLLSQQRGAEILIRRRETDVTRRQQVVAGLANPLNAFTDEEKAIIVGPPPPYTSDEFAADVEHRGLHCPLTLEIPSLHDMVNWQGQIYSRNALQSLRNHTLPSQRRNPVTNAPLSDADFLGGDTPVTLEENAYIQTITAAYNVRTVRREAKQRYDRLQAQWNTVITLRAAQQETRLLVQHAGGSIVAFPPQNYVQRLIANGDINVQLLGQEAAIRPIQNGIQFGETIDDESTIVLPEPTIRRNTVPPPRPRANVSPIPAAVNPLDEYPPPTRQLPTNLWGDSDVELCTSNFYSLCRAIGFRSTQHFLESTIGEIFGPYGAFFGYIQISHLTLLAKLNRVENKYTNLLRNHNNDRTGLQGEDAPVWFNAVHAFYLWKETNTGAGRTLVNRANLITVQQNLGAVQLPWGPNVPSLRSMVAAESPPQLAGHQEIGFGVVIAQVDDTDDQQPIENLPNQPPRRRRNRASQSGVARRTNRQRTGELAIQDQIAQGHENINSLATSLNSMVRSNAAAHAFSYTTNRVESLRSITAGIQAVMDMDRSSALRTRLLNLYENLLSRWETANEE